MSPVSFARKQATTKVIKELLQYLNLIVPARMPKYSASTASSQRHGIDQSLSRTSGHNNPRQTRAQVQCYHKGLSTRGTQGSQTEAQDTMSKGLRRSKRKPSFTKRADDLRPNGSWMTSLRTPSIKRRTKSTQRSTQDSRVCEPEDGGVYI
jgi:hypothetical protein